MKIYKSLEDAILINNGTLLFRKKIIKRAAEQLYNNEVIYFATLGIFSNNLIGLLVITDKRIFGHAYSLGDLYFQEINIQDIKNVEFSKFDKSFHVYGELCTIDALIVKRSTLNDIQKIIYEIKANVQNSNSQNDQITIKNSSIDMQALKDLKELNDMGIITNEEFENKKKQILNL